MEKHLPHYPGLDGASAVPTRAYDECLVKALETSQRQGTIMVTGDPGVGKTFTCRAVMREMTVRTGAMSVWVQLGRNPSTKEVLTQLLRCLGMEAERRLPAWELAGILGDLLAESPRFVWVDEAQYLRSDAFTTLRTIHDRPDAFWALGLVGTTAMYKVLERDQPELLSRVGRRVHLQPLDDRKELIAVLNRWHPLLQACDNGRLDRMNRLGPKGNFRAWANVLETLCRITDPDTGITDQIEAAALHQCGYRLPADLSGWVDQ